MVKRAASTYVHTLTESEKRTIEEVRETMSARYGLEIGGLLADKMVRSILKLGGCDFMDNVRVCDVNDPAEVAEYEWKWRHRCCGNFDGKLHVKHLGRTFRYGFNFDH